MPEEGLGGVAWFQYWLKLPPTPFYVAERREMQTMREMPSEIETETMRKIQEFGRK